VHGPECERRLLFGAQDDKAANEAGHVVEELGGEALGGHAARPLSSLTAI
jgi:hypothetical protein